MSDEYAMSILMMIFTILVVIACALIIVNIIFTHSNNQLNDAFERKERERTHGKGNKV